MGLRPRPPGTAYNPPGTFWLRDEAGRNTRDRREKRRPVLLRDHPRSREDLWEGADLEESAPPTSHWADPAASRKQQWWELQVLGLSTRCVCVSCSVVSNSLRPHALQPARLLCPGDAQARIVEWVCYYLLQGIFLTQGSKECRSLALADRCCTVWATRDRPNLSVTTPSTPKSSEGSLVWMLSPMWWQSMWLF